MQLTSLNKRLDKVEAVLSPKLDVVFVFTQPGESIEEAILRTLQKQGINEVPDHVLFSIFNLHGAANV